MRIATFNAASIRAREPMLLEWLEEHEPDILCVQETKVENDKFPREAYEDMGYHLLLNGQKSWNGVAILSKLPIEAGTAGFDDLWPNDARVQTARIAGIDIINTYVPNGNKVGSEKWEYKMRWLDRFAEFLSERYNPAAPLIWLGDINIAPEPIDVYDSPKVLGGVGHHPLEFEKLAKITSFGLTDLFRHLHPEKIEFSYWDFVIPRAPERGIGWRIDHIYATAPLVPLVKEVTIDLGARGMTKPSDHTFVVATLDL